MPFGEYVAKLEFSRKYNVLTGEISDYIIDDNDNPFLQVHTKLL